MFKISKIYFTIFIIVIFVVFIWCVLGSSFNKTKIIEAYNTFLEKLNAKNLLNYIQGNSINNIPALKLLTTNDQLAQANNCQNEAVKLKFTQNPSDATCIKICLNDDAKLLNVTNSAEVIFNNSKLDVGDYCIVGERPNCNMNASIALITLNSVVCHPKYPNLFGGNENRELLACNNLDINDPNNVLWDYYYNEAVDPLLVDINDEDELLSDGSFRFRCKFNGLDIQSNKYVENPSNRFHPMRNYCTSLLFSAHPDVQIKILDDDYMCECGDKEITRVENLIPDDKHSLCSPYTYSKVQTSENFKYTLPYPCYNINSPVTDFTNKLPCPPAEFVNQGANIAKVDLYTTTDDGSTIISKTLNYQGVGKFNDFLGKEYIKHLDT